MGKKLAEENEELRKKVQILTYLLEEWRGPLIFGSEEERDKWVFDFRRRVDAEIGCET